MARRKKNNPSKGVNTVIALAVAGIGGYLLYKYFSTKKADAAAGGPAIPPVTLTPDEARKKQQACYVKTYPIMSQALKAGATTEQARQQLTDAYKACMKG